MNIIPVETIEHKIFFFRGKKVMLDRDLANLYGVSTKVLNQAVKRNVKRFPEDFMFQLNTEEMNSSRCQFGILKNSASLRSQIVTSKRGGQRYLSYAFTEQGVAMLSSVLKSERAIQVNILIMRTFTKLRDMIVSNKELRIRLDEMERKYDMRFKVIFDTIKRLMESSKESSTKGVKEIGFRSKAR